MASGASLLGQADAPATPTTPTQQSTAPAQTAPSVAPVQSAPALTPNAPPNQSTAPPPAAPGAQPARNPDGTYTIRQSSRLVILDVVATDAKGNLVTDLKREDFHVTEAKERQAILNFEPAGAHVLSPELTINSTADLDRLAPRAPVNIILLDEFNTRFEDMAFARYSLKKFLEKQPAKLSTTMAVGAIRNGVRRADAGGGGDDWPSRS